MGATVRVRHSNAGAANAPFSIAVEAGYFTRLGLTVTREEVENVGLSLAALTSGAADIVGTGGASILQAAHSGSDLRVVMSLERRNVYAVCARRDVSSIAELRGARLGVTALGCPDHVALNRALVEENLDLRRDCSLVEYNGRRSLWAAFLRGEVAAMAAPPPLRFQAEHEGFTVVRDFQPLEESYQLGAVVTTASFATERSDELTAFVAGMLLAMDRFRSDPDLADHHVRQRGKISTPIVVERTRQAFGDAMLDPTPTIDAFRRLCVDLSVAIDTDVVVDLRTMVHTAPIRNARRLLGWLDTSSRRLR